MKQLAIIAASLIALPASADGDTRIRTTLTGYQEVPVVSTLAKGRLDLKISRAADSIDYTLSYSGLQADVRQAHIHLAQKSVNGPIIVWLCGTATNPAPDGAPTCPQTGSVSGTITSGNVLAALPAQQLAAGELLEVIAALRAGAAYANVHTAVSTTGEIRGQIGKGKGEDDDH
jgi:hypothetical protein